MMVVSAEYEYEREKREKDGTAERAVVKKCRCALGKPRL